MRRLRVFLIAFLVMVVSGYSATLLKHTVAPSGGDYTTLAAAISHINLSHPGLIVADVYAEIEISGSWSSSDTAAISIPATILTNATHYLKIYTDTANRASMPWSTSKYQLVVADYTILNSVDYLILDGLQISSPSSTTNNDIINSEGAAAGILKISNCVIKGSDSGDYLQTGVRTNSSGQATYILNSVLYNIDVASGNIGVKAFGTTTIYNTVCIGGYYGYVEYGGTLTTKNCYAGGTGNNAYDGATMTTCASGDTTGTDGLQSVAVGTDTFVAVAGGSENYHLAVDGLSPLENVGTDTSGDAAPFNFTVDMDGASYADDWDIGAFANVGVSAPTVTTTAITDILGTSATGGGNVTSAGGGTISVRGVCWKTSSPPTTSDSKTTESGTTGSYASSLTSLTANTVYHYRAYATNEAGTSYGAEVDFETDVVPTLAATTAISKITHATASSGGNVTDDGGATITARGVCWNTSTLPTTANSKTTDDGTTGSYSSAITGLSVATTYHVRSYATNSVGTTYGTEVDFTTDTLSDISDAVFTVTEAETLPIISSLSDSTVYVGQSITITGTTFGASEGYAKFGGLTATISSWADTSIACLVPAGSTAGNVVVITSGALESAGTAYTMAVIPTLTTAAISAITSTTAAGGGAVTSDGNATVTAHGICWSTSTLPTIAGSKTDDIADPTPFVSALTSLTRKTTYHVRSYATNPVGTGYGSEVDFDTLAEVPTIAATTTVSSISYTTATSGGNVTDNGSGTISARGVCWNTSNLPTTSNSKTTDSGTTGVFVSAITGLTPNTLYHVRAYATNEIGTVYGTEADFTSLALASPTVTTTAISAITKISASSGGNVADDGGATITDRGICWGTSTNPTTSSSHVHAAGTTGAFTSALTSLVVKTGYHVRAFAINSVGTSYGAEVDFTTLSKSIAAVMLLLGIR